MRDPTFHCELRQIAYLVVRSEYETDVGLTSKSDMAKERSGCETVGMDLAEDQFIGNMKRFYRARLSVGGLDAVDYRLRSVSE
jgi:hypothetical protein